MAKHDQRPDKRLMQCVPCKNDNCSGCVDVTLILLGREPICTCERKKHGGEPRDNQVRDPFSGTVVGPGMVLTEDGVVTIHRAPVE